MATKQDPSAELFAPARLYSYADAALGLGISHRAVRRWVYEGRIPYVQFPQGRRLRGSDLNDWVSRHVVNPSEDYWDDVE
jgi:excisionase family DNA binding protein